MASRELPVSWSCPQEVNNDGGRPWGSAIGRGGTREALWPLRRNDGFSLRDFPPPQPLQAGLLKCRGVQ